MSDDEAVGAASLVKATGSSPTQTVAEPLIALSPTVERTRMVILAELVQLAAFDMITLTTLLSTNV